MATPCALIVGPNRFIAPLRSFQAQNRSDLFRPACRHQFQCVCEPLHIPRAPALAYQTHGAPVRPCQEAPGSSKPKRGSPCTSLLSFSWQQRSPSILRRRARRQEDWQEDSRTQARPIVRHTRVIQTATAESSPRPHRDLTSRRVGAALVRLCSWSNSFTRSCPHTARR
jgi:hypothetical protein